MELSGLLIGAVVGSIAYVGAILYVRHKRKKADKGTQNELEGKEDVE